MEIFQLSCTCPIGNASEPTMDFHQDKMRLPETVQWTPGEAGTFFLVKRWKTWRFVRLIHWFLAMGDNLLVTWLNPTPPKKKVSGLDVDFWLMSIIHFLLEFMSFRVFSNTTRVGDLSQFPTSLTLRMMTLHHLRLGPREVAFNYVTVNSKCLGLKFNHIKKGECNIIICI